MKSASTISNEENVDRILHQDWVVDGIIQLGAFTLRPNETYMSVNRSSVDSYSEDVSGFVISHPMYQYTETTYQCATLSVDKVRKIAISKDGEPVNIDVEVEPRAAHTASHAGIFTRLGATNVKKGVTLPAEALPLGLSADDILMEVGWSLIAISSLEEKLFKDNKY